MILAPKKDFHPIYEVLSRTIKKMKVAEIGIYDKKRFFFLFLARNFLFVLK